jgi:hypothetical protein
MNMGWCSMDKHLKGVSYCKRCNAPIGFDFYGLSMYGNTIKCKTVDIKNIRYCKECYLREVNKNGK